MKKKRNSSLLSGLVASSPHSPFANLKMSPEPRASRKTSRNRIQRHLERHRENCRRDVAANHFRVSPTAGNTRPHRRPSGSPVRPSGSRQRGPTTPPNHPPGALFLSSSPLRCRGPQTRILLMNARLVQARLQGCGAGRIGEPSGGHVRVSTALNLNFCESLSRTPHTTLGNT